MKFIGTLLFIFATAWSWQVVHSFDAISFETHAGIQARLSEILLDMVKKAKPEAQNVRIIKIWSEKVTDQKIKVQFTYIFEEIGESGTAGGQTEVQGTAELSKDTDSNHEDRWNLDTISTTQGNLNFEQGLQISPTGAGNAGQATPTGTPSPTGTPTDLPTPGQQTNLPGSTNTNETSPNLNPTATPTGVPTTNGTPPSI